MFFNAIEKNTYGGVESWMVRVVAELNQRGHKVLVAGRPDSVFLKHMQHADRMVKTFEVKVSGDFNPFTIYRLYNIIRDNKVEMLLVSCNKDLRLGGLAAKWYGTTKVVWRIGVDLTKNNYLHRKLTPKLLDGVIAPSEDLKHQITRFGYLNNKIVTVIPSGTSAYKNQLSREQARLKLRKKYGLPDKAVIAVTSGRFVPEKGHYFLVEAAVTIIQANPEVYFLFLGDGPLEVTLKEQVRQLKLEKHIIFTGFLENFELELLGADLMIHPALAEAFGNSLLDGMQAGMPIVTTNVGGISEVVEAGKTAVVIPPGDSKMLAEAVTKLLRQPDSMKQLGEAGQCRWQENFNLDIMTDRLEKFLKQLTV